MQTFIMLIPFPAKQRSKQRLPEPQPSDNRGLLPCRYRFAYTFRDMEPSDAVESRVRERVDALELLHPRITGCHVVVEAHHRHHRQGQLYHVIVHLVVPEGEIAVSRDPAEHQAHEDIHVAVRDAFDATARRPQDHLRRSRGVVKQHERTAYGSIERVFPENDYGFIRSAIDGQETYLPPQQRSPRQIRRLTVRYGSPLLAP